MKQIGMAALLMALLAIVSTVPANAQPGDSYLRTYDFGGNDSYRSVVANADGGQTLIAFRDGEIEMVKLDRFGGVEWRHGYQEVVWNWPGLGSLIHTSDGGYSFRYQDGNSTWLVHTDQYGREQWRVDLPELGLYMAERDGGGYVVTSTPNNHAMLTLTFLDQNGSFEYDVEFDPMQGLSVGDIQPDGLGNYYVFGIRSGVGFNRAPVFKVDGSGNLLWMQFLPEFDFPAVQCLGGFVTEDGGCVWYGSGYVSSGLYFFDWAALAARLPANGGDPIWQGSFEEDVDGTDDERFVTGVAGAAGHVYLAGDLAGYPSVLELDDEGNELWRYTGPRMVNNFPQYYYFGATFDNDNEAAHFFGMDSDIQDGLQQVFGESEPDEQPGIIFVPVDGVDLPPAGGTLTSSIHIENPTMQQQQVRVRRDIILPNGTSYLLDNVQLTLAAGQMIDIPSYPQMVPAVAPAGEYVHRLTLLNGANQKLSSQAYFFTKQAANANAVELDPGADAWQTSELGTILADAGQGSVSGSNALPTSFAVGEAYPNPFNAGTRVSVTLPQAGELTAIVYDISGRLVGELAKGRYAAGSHELSWTPSSVASGVYFLHVRAGGDQVVRKLVHMK